LIRRKRSFLGNDLTGNFEILLKEPGPNRKKFAMQYPAIEKLLKEPKPFDLEEQLEGLPVTTKKMRSPGYRLHKIFKSLFALS
jgi:hypothetical protein